MGATGILMIYLFYKTGMDIKPVNICDVSINIKNQILHANRCCFHNSKQGCF